jgi:hypothetical protein
MKALLLAAAALVLLAGSACAPATPTVDPAAIQASAVAAASTMVAMTQQSVPTPTEIPPTTLPSPTPLPSPTLIELPTLAFEVPTLAPAPGATSSSDECNGPMAASPAGPLVRMRIQNTTNGHVVLSLYLEKNSFGECGYRGFNLEAHDSLVASDLPQGCYFAGAFVGDPKRPTKAFGSGCISGTDNGTVIIGNEAISVQPDK